MRTGKLVGILYLLLAVTVVTPVFAQSLISAVSAQLCGIVSFVKAIVGVLALALFILGGVLYAIGHFLPAAGQLRQNIQGWAMGMIFAGIVGLVLFMISEPLINTITGIGAAAGAANVAIPCP